jgi:hypothetical protein
VAEFLSHVRRMVLKFVVGRLLRNDATSGEDGKRMDDVTSYYLLHLNDFGLEEAPASACVLYATACGLTEKDLESGHRIVRKKGASSSKDLDESDDDDDLSDDEGPKGGMMALLPWRARSHKSLGLTAPGGGAVPLIDRAHKLMRLWKEGDLNEVNGYVDSFGLRGDDQFHRLLQALTELSADSDRVLLESISNHLGAKGVKSSLLPGERGG